MIPKKIVQRILANLEDALLFFDGLPSQFYPDAAGLERAQMLRSVFNGILTPEGNAGAFLDVLRNITVKRVDKKLRRR